MSMPTEHVEALHQITEELREEHIRKAVWLKDYEAKSQEPDELAGLAVTRAEAELIFANRIAKHEGKLKELGWERKIRVEPQSTGDQPK